MKRNRGGERDLDHIIMAATRGLDRASLEYPPGAGRADPDDGPHLHGAADAVIVEKAIRYTSRGVVGVDIAGPRPGGERYRYAELAPLFDEARDAGLGVDDPTSARRVASTASSELAEVIGALRPDRIGHGIPRGARARADGRAARGRDRPRDLPHVRIC